MPTTRSRSGQPRDREGRFTNVGSVVNTVSTGQIKPKMVVVDQVAAVVSEEQVSSDVNEVSGDESVECDQVSSSANSEFDIEEEGVLEEQQGLGSSLVKGVVGPVADQLFVEMPQSGPSASGRDLGGASLVGTPTMSRSGPALGFVGGDPKGKAKLVGVGSESAVIGGRNSALVMGCPTIPSVKLGAGGNVMIQERDDGAAQRAPWANLFKDNRNLGKGIKLDEWEVDGDIVMLEEDDVDVVEETWGYCLVGLFAGKHPGVAAVRRLREGWKVNCTHWRHRSGWFVFKFQSEEDRRKVLEGGPYFAYGSNLILKNLPRCFTFEGEDVSSVPIWIQLPGLPLDCWNARALGKIVSKVGKPISTDKMTLSKERLSFARVLVEVDASSDITSCVEVRLPTGVVYQQPVRPEFIPKFCKKCRSFGHVVGDCGKGAEGAVGTKHMAFVANRKLRTGGGSVNSIGKNKGGRAS